MLYRPLVLRLTLPPPVVINGCMLETFLLMVVGGAMLFWLLLERRSIEPRFFRLQTLLLSAIAALACGLWAWSRPWAGMPVPVLLYVAAFPAGGLIALLGVRLGATRGRPTSVAVLSVLGGLCWIATALVALPRPADAAAAPPWPLVAVAALLGSLLLGATLGGMLVGHAYLTASRMPIRVLVNACRWLLALAVLRTLFAGAVLTAWWFRLAPDWGLPEPGRLDELTWVVLLVRVLFGLVGPLATGWMALASARIRSTQSATGILYPGLVLVCMGELCFLHLLVDLGLVL